jgi:hypothetical protein
MNCLRKKQYPREIQAEQTKLQHESFKADIRRGTLVDIH